MADTGPQTYTVTFKGGQGRRRHIGSVTDPTSGTDFPKGQKVEGVSRAAADRLQALGSLKFTVEPTAPPKKES